MELMKSRAIQMENTQRLKFEGRDSLLHKEEVDHGENQQEML